MDEPEIVTNLRLFNEQTKSDTFVMRYRSVADLVNHIDKLKGQLDDAKSIKLSGTSSYSDWLMGQGDLMRQRNSLLDDNRQLRNELDEVCEENGRLLAQTKRQCECTTTDGHGRKWITIEKHTEQINKLERERDELSAENDKLRHSNRRLQDEMNSLFGRVYKCACKDSSSEYAGQKLRQIVTDACSAIDRLNGA